MRPTSPLHVALLDVWGSSSQDVWAAGTAGTLLHWNGTEWSRVDVVLPTKTISTLWGSGPDDVWAGGDFNFLLHWDGQAWTRWPLINSAVGITDIHGTGPADVWAVSDGRFLLHFNGTVWTSETAFDRGNTLWSSPDSLWLAGIPGYAYYRQDSTWHWFEQVPLNVRSIWGSGSGDVWFAGANLHHWHDGALELRLAPAQALYGLHGTGANDVWAVGAQGSSLHWNGSAWSEVPTGVEEDLHGVWAYTSQDAFAVGQEGAEILRWNGSTWRSQLTPLNTSFLSLGSSAQEHAWLVGDRGRLFRYEGTAWVLVESPVRTMLRAVWTRNENEAWAVGDAGTILRWDGHSWSVEPSHTTANLLGVWSDGGDGVWAVGAGGTVLRRSGGAWSAVPSGTEADVLALWGASASDLWVLTLSEILHWNGESWKTQVRDALSLAWLAGSGANDVWAAGHLKNELLHWDGNAWKRVSSPLSEGPTSVEFSRTQSLWVKGPDDVWLGANSFVGGEVPSSSYSLLHWDGHEWSRTGLGGAMLDAMAGQGAVLWTLQTNGRVLRSCP
ncbi:hypothetical protein [Archangium sp.]|uniref:hypothetical protein n=1 Tax=Archangium sp. TaxID=1872627 RepID=UPI00389A0B5C